MTQCKLTINKSARGWSYLSEVKYDDWPNWFNTSGGHSTLASTLWHVIGYYCDLPQAEVISITVKGKAMTNAEALSIIVKDLSGSSLNYAIPKYWAILGSSTPRMEAKR